MSTLKKKTITLLAWISACAFMLGCTACSSKQSDNTVTSSAEQSSSMESVEIGVSSEESAAEEESEELTESFEESTESSEETSEDMPEVLTDAEGLGYEYVAVADEEGVLVDEYYVVCGIGSYKGDRVQIPAEINGIPVREISAWAFDNNDKITKIVIPESVKVIGKAAFKWCHNLQVVEILAEEMDSIGEGAFSYCMSLEEINIPEGVKEIPKNAFNMCFNLVKVTLPDTLEYIGENAFLRCLSLEEIAIPKKTQEIDCTAFYHCENLENLDFSNAEKLTRINGKAFVGCFALTEVELPQSLEYIGGSAFAYCSNLTTVKIDKNVEQIDEYAFGACADLQEIAVDKANAVYQSIAGDLYTKDGAIMLQYAIGKEDAVFTVNSSVQRIWTGAFANAVNLTEIHFNEGLISIESYVFYGCENLKEITLPDALKKIGKYAFANCVSLDAVTLPDAIFSIEDFAFFNCEDIKVFFEGDGDAWILRVNCGVRLGFEDADVYFYSEEEPTEDGNWWRYVEENALVWGEELPEENPEETTPDVEMPDEEDPPEESGNSDAEGETDSATEEDNSAVESAA